MSPKAKSPKDGAQRKRDHDARKRKAGLKEFRAWVTPDEEIKLRVFLLDLRQIERRPEAPRETLQKETKPELAADQEGGLEALVIRRTCAWGADDDGIYETECGNAFQLNDGTPADNNMVYCCYCGRLLDAVDATDEHR
jgi:hypothetical protein